MTDTLTGVSRASLAHLRDWVAQGKLSTPLARLELQARGVEAETARLLARVLGELSREPLLAVLDTLIGERDRAERERPRLLWTGPEAPGSAALDTRVQLLELISGARESVFWAGYRFTDKSLLAPLYERMCTTKLDVTMVLEVRSDSKDRRSREQRIDATLEQFRAEVWTWTDIAPALYIDPRTAGWNPDPEHHNGGFYAQMHAKTVVIDAEHCIVGSANFTNAGTTRNIEAGVLLRSRDFARTLLGQWRGLIANGLLRRVGE
ncbi:Cardiolipin synthase B [Enhygromyxa salina]|uniref:Cardiolipin synthase B n=1 Tax=Enhygromyxa salina TaxID=215803 RepID=A0A2S9YGR9_9BACT|nr:DISARM system phospholipase D-like protein DrmC [Enhygromyxa salina]PRQ04289.1 Cardiolipin synthase B [Enhygromyxa salina]